MPIDIDRVLGAELPEISSSWAPDDLILYHLGVGAGVPATDAGELAYTYEGGLKVLPTWGVMPVMPAIEGLLDLPGLDIDLASLLHGEQELEVHGEIPVAADVRTSGRVTHLFDKGKAALLVFETTTRLAEDGRPLFTNRFSAFLRGEGGFGGEGGPPAPDGAPARPPDLVVERGTLPQQALLYRLSGDKNPMHADPALAARAGFERPILHGLCSYAVVCRAAVDTLLAGEVGRVCGYRARFAGVVYPGETIVVELWEEGEGIAVAAHTAERNSPVITNAVIGLR
jgi:acyl dehydratase